MPVANFTRIDLGQLYMPFLEALFECIAACNARGANYIATKDGGYRSFREQAGLYFQGRTNTKGPIVTNAPPGFSAHNFGLAVDFVRMVGVTPSWAEKDYDVLGEEAEKAGLVWGGSWQRPDRPHVQWPGYVSSRELLPLRTVYLKNREAPLTAVFYYLGNAGPRGGKA